MADQTPFAACASQQLGTGRLSSSEPSDVNGSFLAEATGPGLKKGSLTPVTSPWSIMSAQKTAFGFFSSHLTVMYLYARGGESEACGAHLISRGGGGRGAESVPARLDSSPLKGHSAWVWVRRTKKGNALEPSA